MTQLNSKIQNRINSDQNLQNQINSITSFYIIIVDINSFLNITAQNTWFVIQGIVATIPAPGKYLLNYRYYGQSTSSNRIHHHRISLNGVPQVATQRSQFIRNTTVTELGYSVVIDILNPATLRIECMRSNGTGSLQSFEKSMVVQRIGNI